MILGAYSREVEGRFDAGFSGAVLDRERAPVQGDRLADETEAEAEAFPFLAGKGRGIKSVEYPIQGIVWDPGAFVGDGQRDIVFLSRNFDTDESTGMRRVDRVLE